MGGGLGGDVRGKVVGKELRRHQGGDEVTL